MVKERNFVFIERGQLEPLPGIEKKYLLTIGKWGNQLSSPETWEQKAIF